MIGSIVEYLFAPDDPEAVIEKMADPATRIVSLTVTEGGYNIHQVTGEFDADEPGRPAADLRPARSRGTTFGLITEALVRRRDRGLPPFTVMSCDNIQGNGHVAQEQLHRLRPAAGRRDARRLGASRTCGSRTRWSTGSPRRPPTRTGPSIAERFGVLRRLAGGLRAVHPVGAGGHFDAGRPPLEDVGVQLVEDVEPYELMKLRLLNASHQALCYFGYLAGYRLVHEVARTRCSPTSCSPTWTTRPPRPWPPCRASTSTPTSTS